MISLAANTATNSQTYRRLVTKDCRKRSRRTIANNTNIIGWQIDNELNNENPDVSARIVAPAFRVWLRQKYEG